MADIRRVVSITHTGTVTTLKDVGDNVTFTMARDSFKVTSPPRQQIQAARQRRYGGSRTIAERHDNGSIAFTMLVVGATADAAIQSLEDALTVLESPRIDMFFEWRPDGATDSTYFEIRGPASYQSGYQWVMFAGEKAWPVEVTIPVGPLARGTRYTITIPSTTLPATVALSTAITGDAPALADITLRASSGLAAPIWALFAWTKRTGSPLASSVAPFGIIEAETGTSLSTWAVTADANYRGSSGLKATTSGAGTAAASFAVDPSVMVADDFTDTIDVEVWARVQLASTVVTPTIKLSLEPNAGTSYGQPQYSSQWGSAGKVLTLPSSGTVFRFVSLGTLKMPVDATTPLKWNVKLAGSWAAGSSGTFGVDYLTLVPSRARALSPSGKANDSTYPAFIASTNDTSKTIRSDLSGATGVTTLSKGRDSGLGGSLIELPPGDVDLLLKLSSTVADDPTVNTASEQISHTAITGSVAVTPRFWLAQG